VTPSPGAAVTKLRVVLVLLAALAIVAACSVSTTASAGASSGGVSATDDDSAKSESKYKRLWKETSRRNKHWANRTAKCESGRDPDAIGGGGKYRGAFQFMKSTWRRAPKSPGGDPVDYPYRTQAVVAVALKHRDGADHWPNCG
jgi:soluble lytic murein transglycosylase-like protein